MRILFIWLTVISLCGFVTLGWYLSQIIVLSIVHQLFANATGETAVLLSLLEYVVAWWGVIFDIVIILWGIIASQAQDTESVIYG
jgi:hypothetical protein